MADPHAPLSPGEIRLLRDVLNPPESDWQVEVADERGYWWLWLLIGAVVGGLIVWAVMR